MLRLRGRSGAAAAVVSIVLAGCAGVTHKEAIRAEKESIMLNLIPQPRTIQKGKGRFDLSDGCVILWQEGIGDRLPAELVASSIREATGLDVNIAAEKNGATPKDRVIVFGDSRRSGLARTILRENHVATLPSFGKEGYMLYVNEHSVVVTADSAPGFFYGAQTLIQLVHSSPSAIIPALTIRDWPLMEIRGISDDISRGQVSNLENFKKIIRVLASYKMNVYMPYIEDMFTFDKHPLIGKGRGALTKDEVAELDEYAKRYHVEVIPIYESLGHQEHMLSIPEYNAYAEVADTPWSLSPAKQETYELLNELYSEICPAFSSPYFHIGCDESWDIGKGASKELVEKMGVAGVHAQHYKKVHALATRYGKKVMMYGDICLEHPEIIEKLPRDITIVDWHYDAAKRYPSIKKFQDAGFRVLVSPATQAWTRIFPHYDAAAVNIENFIKRGYEQGVWGEVTSTWGDNGAENLREPNYYGFAFSADCAWSPDKATYTSFKKRFFPQFYGTDIPALPEAFDHLVRINRLFPNNFRLTWDEPFQKEPTGRTVEKAQALKELMEDTLDKLKSAEGDVKRNQDNIRYLRLAARRGAWLARKILCEVNVAQLEEATGPTRLAAEECVSECRSAADELEQIKEEFRKLWLLTNKEAGLAFNLDRYDRQIRDFRAKADEIAQTFL
jgi:hexosaminidase